MVEQRRIACLSVDFKATKTISQESCVRVVGNGVTTKGWRLTNPNREEGGTPATEWESKLKKRTQEDGSEWEKGKEKEI